MIDIYICEDNQKQLNLFKKYILKDTLLIRLPPWLSVCSSCVETKTYSAAFAKSLYLRAGSPAGSRNGVKS